MALTFPMRPIPGELLTTTENQEDAADHKLWRVPYEHGGALMRYGELMTVIACLPKNDEGCDEADPDQFPRTKPHRFEVHALHHRLQRVIQFDDIEMIGWVWRPNFDAIAWRYESSNER